MQYLHFCTHRNFPPPSPAILQGHINVRTHRTGVNKCRLMIVWFFAQIFHKKKVHLSLYIELYCADGNFFLEHNPSLPTLM